MNEEFYKTYAWKLKRKEILDRDNNECQLCKSKGKFKPAKIVHHIKNLDSFPELALDDNNLISVCFDCHELLHPGHHRISDERQKIINKFPEHW